MAAQAEAWVDDVVSEEEEEGRMAEERRSREEMRESWPLPKGASTCDRELT